ncbi:hypothetical protein ZIOFF_050075 [Zingiber officinale]|uniref:Uncharacterized protein n=1 Tax=Zingiber officinale TaxID=94328 RepID=A0A8J5KQA0_ZINOF|nr:hypothetical protein ZIOFF_050075 [Zingiber officinale]
MPQSLAAYLSLRIIDLSNNMLQGPLPSFASKSFIQLLLCNNNLTGTIPDSLAHIHILKILDVNNNNLNRNMPKFRTSVKVETDGNPNLCKNSDSGGESSSPTSGAPSPPDKLSIVGIIIAMVVLVACSVGLLLHHLKRKNKKKFELSIESANAYRDEPQSLHMSIKALKTTTNNFSEDFILDKGGFGIIYKGNLSGTLIAVKKSIYDLMSQNGQQEFKTEIDVLRKDGVICSRDRIIAINLAQSGISGSLSPVHGNLTSLTSLQLEFNNICDPLPRLSKLSLLQKIYLQANAFDDIPSGFFIGLSSLQEISLDDLPLTPWSLSQDITSATGLVYFSAINAYLTGLIPDFLGSLSSLDILHLSYNKLTSPLPSSFAGSILMKLFLDHQQSRDKISG